MKQLRLNEKTLKKIGFSKVVHPEVDEFNPEKTTYEIPVLNGCFYYNEKDPVYRWYHRTDIGENSNHICLNIADAPSLFTMLRVFGAKYTLILI